MRERAFSNTKKDDGSIAYTRDGTFHIDNTGRLVTNDGFPVVPEIVVPENVTHDKINVGMDGIVTVRVGEETQEIGQITLANFINPAGLIPWGETYMGLRSEW